MNLIRFQRHDPWLSPFGRLDTLRDEINRLFDAPLGDFFGEHQTLNGWTPALDVYEEKDNLVVKVELPGVKKDEIDVSVHENTLTVSGERKSERTEEDASATRAERYFGRFQRTVTLPKPVDKGKITARYKDGILTVTLAKTEEAKPKQIQVRAV